MLVPLVLFAALVHPRPADAQTLLDLLRSIEQGGGWVTIPIENGKGTFVSDPLPTAGLTLSGCMQVYAATSGRWELRARDTLGEGHLEATVSGGETVPFRYRTGSRAQIRVDARWSEPRDTTLFVWVGLETSRRSGRDPCTPGVRGRIGSVRLRTVQDADYVIVRMPPVPLPGPSWTCMSARATTNPTGSPSMRASPTVLASAHSFADGTRPPRPPSLERLRGRWLCSITVDEKPPRTIATGLFDLLHAGSYLVGSGWADGVPIRRPRLVEDATAASAAFEGSIFGAARDEEIVFWITNRVGTALWVLRGRLDGPADTIRGSATYTDADHASDPPYEATFVLTRL